MATYEIEGFVFGDSSMEDGLVRYSADGFYFMTEDTWYTLTMVRKLREVQRVIASMGEGTHLIPRGVLDPHAASDVSMALDFLEPAESDSCTLPHCLQPATSTERGFPLCSEHSLALQDWDSLVA
jgi:hypothetical protein